MTKQYHPKHEDVEKIKELAKKLNNEWRASKRMDIQQEFVREMSQKYDHEYATMMLTKAWWVAEEMQKREMQEDYV